MKSLILALTLTLSSTAFARQYFQCSIPESSDVMVVNLTTPEKGTLFMSSGMQNPDDERTLVNIAFDRKAGEYNIYAITDEAGKGEIAVPVSSLGKPSNYVAVELTFSSYSFKFLCFSRIYND